MIEIGKTYRIINPEEAANEYGGAASRFDFFRKYGDRRALIIENTSRNRYRVDVSGSYQTHVVNRRSLRPLDDNGFDYDDELDKNEYRACMLDNLFDYEKFSRMGIKI